MWRWRVLLACASITGFGFAMAARELGVSVFAAFWLLEVGGILVATAVAFVAAIRGVRARWPAVVALVGAAPMGYRLLQILPHVGLVITESPWSLGVVVFGSAATITVGVYAAFRRLPPPRPDDQIAAARVVG